MHALRNAVRALGLVTASLLLVPSSQAGHSGAGRPWAGAVIVSGAVALIVLIAA